MERLTATITGTGILTGGIKQKEELNTTLNAATSVYENNYERLKNQPKINGEVLIGDKSFEDLGENEMGALEIIEIFNSVWNKKG